MKRRVLAVFAVLVILVAVLATGAAANVTTDRYEAGYAIRDINPWVDLENKVYNESDPTQSVLPLPMSGYANSSDRLSNAMTDDNGDGKIDNTDGLQVTCTSVTDAWGTTVMYFTLDAISGYSGLTTDLRKAMVETLGADVIKGKQIMVCGSHTHEGVDVDGCRSKDAGTVQRTYYEYVLSQMVDAGVAAYNSRTEVVMTKGEIDASESSGYQLNYVRHYTVEEQKKVNGQWTVTNQFVGGSNFGGTKTPANTSTLIRTAENVSESNDTMYLLQFTPTNGDAPIVLVNWRAHATLFSGTGSASLTVSSDYINSLRYQMEKAGYRAAFIQSASGNINARFQSDALTPWCGVTVPAAELPNPTTANRYGYILSRVALDCLENKMTGELDPGRICSIQTGFYAYAYAEGEGLIAAADAWYAEVEAGVNVKYPYKYTHTDGQTYILNSKFHANKVRSRRNYVDGVTQSKFELNAIAMGKSFALVTSPCEMFDRYSLEATLENTTDNDWLDLINDTTYGTPWLLGYTNGHMSYIPNALAYTYNEGHASYGLGAYEANVANVRKGEGEKFIVKYAQLLDIVGQGPRVAMCDHCGEDVEWTAWMEDDARTATIEAGHYYLLEDWPESRHVQQSPAEGAMVCLDLNGHSIATHGRSFGVSSGTTLNIMGEGTITSYSKVGGNNPGSGTISVANGATLNLYGGTLTAVNMDDDTHRYIGKAGVIGLQGTMNMYGGTILGANMKKSDYFAETDTENGCGGSIYIYATGTLNISGGQILSGSVPEGSRGPCVYLYTTSSAMNLSGDAVVEEIYLNRVGALNIHDTFSGTTALEINTSQYTLADGLVVGVATDAVLTDAAIACINDPSYNVYIHNGQLKLSQRTAQTVATTYGKNGVRNMNALQSALNFSGTNLVVLRKDTASSVKLSKDCYLELNGYSINSTVTVADGATLYVMDSCTNDLDISDGKYGKIQKMAGNVTGADRNAAGQEAAYMKVTESDGASFHLVEMVIESMTLRSAQAGLYYKSTIRTNPLAEANIAQFGVALSVKGMPNAQNITRDCHRSIFHDFAAAKDTYTGTLLRWVMKSGNSTVENRRNAEMPVYGRAYVLTGEGQYLFGDGVSRNFRELVEGADALWETLTDTQKAEMGKLYMDNIFVMKYWDVPNLRANFGKENGDISFDDLLG